MSSYPKAIINPQALKHNLKLVRSLTSAKILAVVKADAYGHGINVAAQALTQTDGFAVARLSEALALRELTQQHPIIVFSENWTKDDVEICHTNKLTPVLHRSHHLALFDAFSSSCWIKIDTGMHRLGLDLACKTAQHELTEFLEKKHQCVLMSHFAEAEKTNSALQQFQQQNFLTICEIIDPLNKHLRSAANSASCILHPSQHYDWVRPGIMLYGANPSEKDIHLQTAMCLQAEVIALRKICQGETVGYNSRWTAQQTSLIATINIGYADGYPRHAKNSTPVRINNVNYPLVGTVSMDSISVDITGGENIQVGDIVELWGANLKVNTIADHSDTISYQLFCNLGNRVRREVL